MFNIIYYTAHFVAYLSLRLFLEGMVVLSMCFSLMGEVAEMKVVLTFINILICIRYTLIG